MHGTPKYGTADTHLDYANPAAPKGGTLRQAASGTFNSLNPYAIRGTAAQGLHLFYDRLMIRVWDEPFTLYPLIAARADIPADRSGLTVHLNPDARFHDGSPITATDVVFSFEMLRDHGRPNMRRIYRLADHVETPDDHTVTFRFGDGYDEETVMIFAMMPVLSKEWWTGRTFDSATLDMPLSNGPYRIASFEAGRRIVYERVPDYWAADLPVNRGHYNFDRLVYDYYRDDTVALESFKAGNFDVRREGDAGRWASAYDFPAIQRGDITRHEISHGRPERVRALIFNTRRAPFDDRNVRKALNYALDFDWLNRNLYYGLYHRIDSYFPNSELAATSTPSDGEKALLAPFRDDLPAETFGTAWQPPKSPTPAEKRQNLRRADALLKKAGWVVKDGVRVREDAPDQHFRFEILLGSPEDEKMVLSFINDLRRLGITAQIRVMDSAAFRGRLNDYDYDMVLYHWRNSLSPGTEQMLYWSCESAAQPARWNFAGKCHPAIDSLAQAIAHATDRQALVDHARALDRVMMWGFYMIPLYYAGADYVAIRNNIAIPDNTPVYGMVLETWWHRE